MDRISLKDRVAIVSGSGAGLGRVYAIELARRGAAVVVNDVVRERADAVVAEIQGAGGAAVASGDSVAQAAGARAIVELALDRFGGVHALVCNAGIMRNALFAEQSDDDLEALLDVHVRGSWHLTQAVWPIMRERGYGRVLMVSSAAGMFGMPGVANYAATKGAIYGLGRALAFEGRDLGILVNILLPGAATTISKQSPVPDYARHFRSELRAAITPRRAPEAVAPMVAYLLSDACAVTGETFSALAGRFARVFVGVTDGWFAENHLAVTAEDVAAHLDAIRDASRYCVPADLYGEYEGIGHHLGVPDADGPAAEAL